MIYMCSILGRPRGRWKHVQPIFVFEKAESRKLHDKLSGNFWKNIRRKWMIEVRVGRRKRDIYTRRGV
jgi:hypothetical protein